METISVSRTYALTSTKRLCKQSKGCRSPSDLKTCQLDKKRKVIKSVNKSVVALGIVFEVNSFSFRKYLASQVSKKMISSDFIRNAYFELMW